ncbi:MAG: tryptophan 2,3-dioxygenase family protein [Candidatus Sericytochromatia bacterium]|nr:tryptophan 2,3-dioxygenase family protein [Candidatus Sericytochromatia bacterium]
MTAPRLPDAPGPEAMTYGDYLRIRELLELQHPQSDPPHHDELLFIVIHQAYELWFKLMLHELEVALSCMAERKVLRAHHFMRRVTRVQELLLHQIHVLETMSPQEFAEFRHILKPASGFQSLQFRELEFLAGLRDDAYMKFFAQRPEMQQGLTDYGSRKTIWEGFVEVLLHRFPAEDVEAALELLYRNYEANVDLYMLAESLVDFDALLSQWRYHHVLVVARIIGDLPGTGGSEGVAYLKTTLDRRAFPLLWQIRSRLGDGAASWGRPSAGPPGASGDRSGGGCPFGH